MSPSIDRAVHTKIRRSSLWSGILTLILLGLGSPFSALCGEDYEREPINYDTATPENPISRLQAALEEGAVSLSYEANTGYLSSLLQALEVPVSSQTLVFSKTSLQRNRITPRSPRALYFNDDVYVGYCQDGDVLELSVADPNLGGVFYTLDQKAEKATLVRQNDHCLTCHSSNNTKGVPGHLVRSVYVDQSGFPIFSMGTHRIDHSSPLEKRWGGWYVTGTHGDQKHLGNLVMTGTKQKEPVDNSAGQNVTSLDRRFKHSSYLTPHSDLVALMVLEHQVEAHNLITKANFETRQALHTEAGMNKALNEPPEHRWESTTTRIRNTADRLVKYLLFCDEAPLHGRLTGTSSYADEFSQWGPRDEQGRSLRDFDLERRLFKYPCSYLVYSKSFDSLPGEVKEVVYRKLWDILTATGPQKDYKHLSDTDRSSILEILRSTKKDLPPYWYPSQSAADTASSGGAPEQKID
ncbi:hypothetical protein [Schlesneria sp. DSM 10557]|uniref:hypothetical protein n=1 Tax=Schlesneria sp. DSM 10557 TaxID=3044399 RepID=UPI0035A18D15